MPSPSGRASLPSEPGGESRERSAHRLREDTGFQPPPDSPRCNSPPRFPAAKSTVGLFPLFSLLPFFHTLSLTFFIVFLFPPSLSLLSFFSLPPFIPLFPSFRLSFSAQSLPITRGWKLNLFSPKTELIKYKSRVGPASRLTSGSWSPPACCPPVWPAGRAAQ